LRILRVLAFHRQLQSVAQLSLELELHKSTVVRLLHTLMAETVVVQDVDTKRYALNPAVLMRMAQFTRPLSDFVDAVHGVLHELVSRTGATAMLALPDHRGRFVGAALVSLPDSSVRMDPLGQPPAPLHATAAGKCYLAHLADSELDRYVSSGLERLTPRTITSPLRLKRELHRIRALGYAVNRGEASLDIDGVAVPLRGPSGGVGEALAIAYPAAFPPRRDIAQLVAELQKSAETIGGFLSYEWWSSRVRASRPHEQAAPAFPDSPDPGFGDAPLPAVRSVVRVLRILGLLVSAPEGMTIAEVARRRHLPGLTARRLLRTLEREGLVTRDAPGRGYRLDAVGWASTAELLRSAASLNRLVRGVLQSLTDQTGSAATIAIPDATRRRAVDLLVFQPRRAVRVNFREDVFPPLHSTSGGKCYLAAQSPLWLEAYIQEGLSAWTVRTITSPEQLRRELAQVRERGCALNLEETDVGVGAMAVPLRTSDGVVAGAVTLASPIQVMTEANIRLWLPLLRMAADQLSYLLVSGWQQRMTNGEQ
jgi:DNA-binding IclR family transcriptional regulator